MWNAYGINTFKNKINFCRMIRVTVIQGKQSSRDCQILLTWFNFVPFELKFNPVFIVPLGRKSYARCSGWFKDYI